MSLYCKYCNKECKSNNSLHQHEIRCSKNENRIYTDTFKNYRQNFGSWNKGLTKESDERVKLNAKKIIKSLSEYNRGRHLSDEHKKHISEGMLKANLGNIKRHSYGRAGYYDNIWFASTYELAYYIYSKDHNINFIRNKNRFKYMYLNKERNYTPDFYLIDKNKYIEIKGYETEKDKVKYKAVNNLVVLYYNHVQHMITYVQDKYNIDDISLLYK